MSSREIILKKLRDNAGRIGEDVYKMPDFSFKKCTFSDPVSVFINTLRTAAGANCIEVGNDDYMINLKIKETFPDAGKICCSIPGIEADINPDTIDEAKDLDGIDIGVVEGGVACAENGCVWVPMNMKQKAVCFIAERLVIIVSRKNIVNNMHEAYEVLDKMDETSKYGFGTFISGPSKTADIEQSLVYGAQAAKDLTVILTD